MYYFLKTYYKYGLFAMTGSVILLSSYKSYQNNIKYNDILSKKWYYIFNDYNNFIKCKNVFYIFKYLSTVESKKSNKSSKINELNKLSNSLLITDSTNSLNSLEYSPSSEDFDIVNVET